MPQDRVDNESGQKTNDTTHKTEAETANNSPQYTANNQANYRTNQDILVPGAPFRWSFRVILASIFIPQVPVVLPLPSEWINNMKVCCGTTSGGAIVIPRIHDKRPFENQSVTLFYYMPAFDRSLISF